jgi:predicted RNA polymerase sigma factor
VEAAIAAAHAAAPRVEETDWEQVVSLYDRLMAIAPSPVVALNRAIAIAERDGAERGIAELQAIEGRDRLEGYPFYPAALGELELRRGDRERALTFFSAALAAARNPTERRLLEKRVRACGRRAPR